MRQSVGAALGVLFGGALGSHLAAPFLTGEPISEELLLWGFRIGAAVGLALGGLTAHLINAEPACEEC